MQQLLDVAHVLVDAGGANDRGDATLLGLVVDAAILVIEVNAMRQAQEVLEAVGVRLLGAQSHIPDS